MASKSFKNLGVDSFLVRALDAMAIRDPTEVQQACIPPILSGRDCIGNARTGSGKTIAFALPILQTLAKDPYGIYSLVLTPTRELAFQIYDQFKALGSVINLETSVVVGGMNIIHQANELKNRPHVVVATPGRLADLINSNPGEIVLSKCKYLVLDEADRLLSDTFASDLKYIIGFLPKQRQTLLFTATMTDSVLAIQDRDPGEGKMKPFVHLAKDDISIPTTLKQKYTFIPSQVRECYLYYMLLHLPSLTGHVSRRSTNKSKTIKKSKNSSKTTTQTQEKQEDNELSRMPQSILFVSSCRACALISLMLDNAGINNVALHSQLVQRERLKALDDFRANRAPLLVATDVASRGLDIPEVDVVINWDLPRLPDDYIHRVGRAARAGRVGTACNFVTESDVDLVEAIEERVGSKMEKLDMPEDDVLAHLNKISTFKRMASMQMHSDGFGKRKEINQKKAAAAIEGGKKKKKQKN